MKHATKAQLDRAVHANRECERLRGILESSEPLSSEDWAKTARAYADMKHEAERANRVLRNIEAFNAR